MIYVFAQIEKASGKTPLQRGIPSYPAVWQRESRAVFGSKPPQKPSGVWKNECQGSDRAFSMGFAQFPENLLTKSLS